jgi:hypothetical protein
LSDPIEKSDNYLSRHWRGKLPLYVSFWFNGVVAYIAVTLIGTLIFASIALWDEFSPAWAMFAVGTVWLVTSIVLVWQVVGTWRSASSGRVRHKWAKLWIAGAKIVLLIAVARTAISFMHTGVPKFTAYHQILNGDAKLGKASFRILRDGHELELSGSITFGTLKELSQLIATMKALQIIRLNSTGGRINEAQRIGDLIKGRGLDTLVSSQCLSACTIIFLSGKNRFITADAKIGFHQPTFPGLSTEERKALINLEEKRLRQLGVGTEFSRRAISTAPSDIWLPSPTLLLREKVATEILK